MPPTPPPPITPPSTTKTRILILSDTHSHPPFPPTPTPQHPYTHPLPPADILIHCGDLTTTGLLSEHLTTFQWIAAHPAKLKLVVAGNHDVTLDEGWYRERVGRGGDWRIKRGGKDGEGDGGEEVLRRVREVWCGEEARRAGVVYLEEGWREVEWGEGRSVTIYSSPYTPEYCDWAFPYPRHIDRFNPTPTDTNPTGTIPPPTNPIPTHPPIDILITHGPPHSILDATHPSGHHVGCPHLLTAVKRCKPLLHCFGHIHEGWGAERWNWVTGEVRGVDVGGWREVVRERGVGIDLTGEGRVRRGEETVFVNASVMDVGYRAVNAPWVLDLDLGVRGEVG